MSAAQGGREAPAHHALAEPTRQWGGQREGYLQKAGALGGGWEEGGTHLSDSCGPHTLSEAIIRVLACLEAEAISNNLPKLLLFYKP